MAAADQPLASSAHNPLCDPGERSWTWNAILPRWVAWKSIVTEWLKAQQALAIGDKQPLKVFLNETTTMPWREEYIVELPKISITRVYSVTVYAVKGAKIEAEQYSVRDDRPRQRSLVAARASLAERRLLPVAVLRPGADVRTVESDL
jgi:Phage terminase large subunit (GpA)